MIQLGTASKIITPEDIEKLDLQGMGRTCALRGALDDIEVNVFVLRDEQQQLIICVVDAVFVHIDFQQALEEALQIGENAMLMLTCTHDHSASASAFDKSNPEHGAALDAARDLLKQQCLAAINEAQSNVQAVEVGATRIELADSLGTNRRAKLDNGCCVTAWGAGPSIPPGAQWIDYAGPDANWIDVIAFKASGADRARAVLTSYGSHIHFYEIPMVTGEGGGYARCHMREQLQADVMYSTAYAGDVALQFHHPMPPGGQDEFIEWQRSGSMRFAQAFANQVEQAVSDLRFEVVDSLQMQTHAWASERGAIGEMHEHYLIQTARLGKYAICSLPGEMFIEWDQVLRAQLPCEQLLVLGYNVSWLGYVATPLGFEEGSYECMRGPADALGYGDAVFRVKSSTYTGDEIMTEARRQLLHLFSE